MSVIPMRYTNKAWNTLGYDFGKWNVFNAVVGTAIRMSQAPNESPDGPFSGGMVWGKGKWPTIQFVQHNSTDMQLYGGRVPASVDMMSPYGLAFQYADQKWNGGKYTGGKPAPGADPIGQYFKDLEGGAKPLPFTMFVTRGHGKVGGKTIPNVEETQDVNLILTASFNKGSETWRDISISSIP